MEITLFGIKIRVELAIACMILGAIICYMLFCSCSLREGRIQSATTMAQHIAQEAQRAQEEKQRAQEEEQRAQEDEQRAQYA